MKRKKTYRYSNGLKFDKVLLQNLADLLRRVKGNKAAMIVIDGQVGEGKTTLAVECADEIQGGEINLREQIALGGGDFTKKLKLCYSKGHRVLVYDEAGDFNKRGSLTKFNAMINRVFETYRTFNIIVILCLPSLHSLDETLFEKGIIRLVLHVQDRTQRSGSYRGYSLYRAHYLREYMKKLVVKPFAYHRVKPNFYGNFLDLDPERAKELDKISTKGKLDILEEGEIIYHGLLSMQDLRVMVERSYTWCDEKLKELGIKPVKVWKRKKYYDSSVAERLLPLIQREKTDAQREKEGRINADNTGAI